jgi:hypothetical protein
MKHALGSLLVVIGIVATSTVARAALDADIAAANAAGHPVFLIVSEGASPALTTARTLATEAQKLAPSASILELNRTDSVDAATVRKYRVASVPVPMILVIAANGAAAGGARPESTTPARLAAMIPSPAKAAYLKALEDKKAPLLVFGRAKMPERAGALEAVNEAVTAMKGAAAAIEVDLDSETEAAFVQEISVDVKTTSPWVAVYNAKGQPTQTFVGIPKVADVVAAATKEGELPCCPGGRCGPNGCK